MSDKADSHDDAIVSRVADRVFASLRQMEREADSIVGNGVRAGLVHYAKHRGVRQYERSWKQRLAELLTESGHSTRNEVPYPNSSGRCDVVVDFEAFLLIGFDAKASPMVADVEELIRQEKLPERGWKGFGPEVWPDSNDGRCRVSCWFWCRKAT